MERSGDSGVTLVEVLVALSMFSLIAVAGFSLLDSILRVSRGTEGRLERMAEIDRALLVIRRDLQTEIPGQLVWDGGGLSFAGANGEIGYRVADGGLQRQNVEGATDQRLLEDVQALSVRLLDNRMTWHAAWPPEVVPVVSLPPSLIGLEMSLTLPEGPVTRLIELPAQALP